MRKFLSDVKVFCQCKCYVIGLTIIALAAYGFAISHYAIGMDDTVIPLYFEEGLAPYVGRWSLFLINKFFHISDFVPWMTELASVIILMLSTTLWCVLWKRICQNKVVLPIWSYLFVAAVFISCPLISEVFVFYLHNGVCLGYGVTALAVFALLSGLSLKVTKVNAIGKLLLSAVLLTVALGFYESFIVVYIMGALLCFFLIRCLYGKKEKESPWRVKLSHWIGSGLLTVSVSVVLRFIVLKSIVYLCKLDRFNNYNVLYRKLFGDIFTAEGELTMVLKRFWVKYYVNAVAYLPITVLVVAIGVIGVYSLYRGIRKKDFILPVCTVVLVLLPIFMSLVEGLTTRYRTAQYVPLVCAFAVLLILIELYAHQNPKWILVCSYLFVGILIFNQCTDMNKWFYIDYLKYQDAREVMDQVAYDLEKDYDATKPIVFRGAYVVPYEICSDAYVSFSSAEYGWICRMTDPIDTHLKEKYFAPIGFCFAESPVVSVLQWGITAFDGTSQQLIEFWRMHGHDSFRCVKDLQVIEEAEAIRENTNMPGYPKKGYIMELEDYIIVNLADAQD